MNKGKLELFNDNIETILSKENNEVFMIIQTTLNFLAQIKVQSKLT